MDKQELAFTDYNKNCPCFTDEGRCLMQVSYNGHVNDPKYGSCVESSCPVFYWAELLIGNGE